jgi:hypothetical protein
VIERTFSFMEIACNSASFLEAGYLMLVAMGANHVKSGKLECHHTIHTDIVTMSVVFDSSEWTGR